MPMNLRLTVLISGLINTPPVAALEHLLEHHLYLPLAKPWCQDDGVGCLLNRSWGAPSGGRGLHPPIFRKNFCMPAPGDCVLSPTWRWLLCPGSGLGGVSSAGREAWGSDGNE